MAKLNFFVSFLFLVCLAFVAHACTSNQDCNNDEYCERDYNCNGIGVCTETPEVCILLYSPVCGCDGETYGNDCNAHGSGTSIASAGSCDSPKTSNQNPNADDSDDGSNSLGSRIAWAGVAVVLFLAFL